MDKNKLLKKYKEVQDELTQQIHTLKQTQKRIDHLIKKRLKLEEQIYGDK